MKFSELVTSSRYRLQDIRTKSGALITTASEDGIRWTSTQIQELCKGALHELYRSLTALKLSNYINDAGFTYIVSVNIVADAGYAIITGLEDITFYKVERIQLLSDTSKIYDPVSQSDFFSNRYRTLSNDSEDLIDVRVYTTVFNKDEDEVQVLCLPIPTITTPAQAVVKVALDNYYVLTGDFAVDLPFVHIDDLILTYVERQAALIDKDMEQIKLSTELIYAKLKEMQIDK